MTDQPKPTVQVALSAVIAELPAIGKGDKSPQGYSFRGIEAITKQLQPLLAKHWRGHRPVRDHHERGALTRHEGLLAGHLR